MIFYLYKKEKNNNIDSSKVTWTSLIGSISQNTRQLETVFVSIRFPFGDMTYKEPHILRLRIFSMIFSVANSLLCVIFFREEKHIFPHNFNSIESINPHNIQNLKSRFYTTKCTTLVF